MELKPLRPGVVEYLRGFAFGVVFFVAFFLAFLAILADLALSCLGRRYALRPFVHWLALMLPRLFGMKIEVRGKENLPKGGCVMLCKHMSMYETCIIGTMPNATPVIRANLSKVPIWSSVVGHLGVIWVERNSGYGGLMSLMRSVESAVKGGRVVAVFPEGTRTTYGQEARMKLGIMQLYPRVIFVPVALNCGLYFGKGIFSPKFRGTAVIEIQPPISPKLDIATAREEAVVAIQRESNRLCRESLASFRRSTTADE